MLIHPSDNVEIRADGQKYALAPIAAGADVIKYGFPIGKAKVDIAEGEFISPHNLASKLSGLGDWTYTPFTPADKTLREGTFMGYRRKNGDVGVRNEIWIVPTVGCINGVVQKLAAMTGAKALTHPHGCSQLGGDLHTTQQILRGLILHPNAGGVLVLGLGCENNGMGEMLKVLDNKYDPDRVRFLNLQECEDEYEEALAILEELKAQADKDVRVPVSIEELRVAVKCGGSDGLSGLTANPLVGKTMDLFDTYGSTILMTEIPEVFGAEQILLGRSNSEETFEAAAGMIRAFRQYFYDHGEGIADNPSPGNIAGGISTLEEKSLGCVQKGGKVTLCGALQFGEQPPAKGGLYMVNGPGNDQVAITNLTAAGAHLILFTTGRGTPLSAPVPTLKVSTNTALYEKKPHWIDFNAGELWTGADAEETTKALFELCIKTAEGQQTKAEEKGFYDIAIFKDGVTL